MNNFKFTPAQQLIANAVISMFISSIITAMTALIEQYSTGQTDLPTLMSVGVTAFVALFFKSLKDYVPAHTQVELQALRDTVTQLRGAASPVTPSSPLVVIHNVPRTVSARVPEPLYATQSAVTVTSRATDVTTKPDDQTALHLSAPLQGVE